MKDMPQLIQDLKTIATAEWRQSPPEDKDEHGRVVTLLSFLYDQYALDFGEDAMRGAEIEICEIKTALWILVTYPDSIQVHVYEWPSKQGAIVRFIKISSETQEF